MNANQQSAVAALDAVRPICERLDRARDGDDRAADVLELWEGTETALRALMGGSSLGGQALIRELRQRELISLGQAYALLEFLGARDRANQTTYRSTPSDVDAAREGFRQLDAGLRQGTIDGTSAANEATPPRQAAAAAAAASSFAPTPAGTAHVDTMASSPSPRVNWKPLMEGRNRWLIPAVLGALILAAILYATFLRTTPDAAMTKGIDLMKEGRRELARTEFATAARDNPTLANPHIFLARLSREEGDLGTARSEAEKAIRLEPTNPIAAREMGLVLFTSKQYDLARNFFIRALKSNPTDSASQGYLGCTLIRMGREVEGNRFLGRAGQGVWSTCAQTLAPPQPMP